MKLAPIDAWSSYAESVTERHSATHVTEASPSMVDHRRQHIADDRHADMISERVYVD